MRYVALLSPGPAWMEGKPIAEQDRVLLGAHLYHLRQAYDQGVVIFGGPFVSGSAGVVLLEAGNHAEAEHFISNDPAVAAGLLNARLEQVRTVFDAFAGRAWEIAAPA
jgi:uncharacterized protein YciI